MSEQRFKLDSDDENEPSEFFTDYGDFWEDGTPKTYWFDDYEDFEDIVDLLNEQQSTIEAKDKEIAELKEDVNDYHNALFDLHKKYDKLEKGNEQLRKELGDCEKFRYQVFKRMGELSDE